MTVVYGLSLFACAGTFAWPAAWAYLGLMTVMVAGYMAIVSRYPDLLAERRTPPADAKRWDKPLVAVIAVVGPVALLLECGLDRRFHWSPPMSAAWKAAGLLLVGFGSALSNWAVASNRFFSAIIRIQRDRGHHVVDAGPYRLVRHPAYLASMVQHARGRSRPGLVVGPRRSWRRSASSSSCGRRWRTGRCAPNSTGMRITPVASATGCCRGSGRRPARRWHAACP